jgi:hypothetical protein
MKLAQEEKKTPRVVGVSGESYSHAEEQLSNENLSWHLGAPDPRI